MYVKFRVGEKWDVRGMSVVTDDLCDEVRCWAQYKSS